MKTLLLPLILLSLVGSAQSAILASWDFESPNTPADLTNATTGPTVSPTTGTGSLFGFHASAATDWTTPAGNISADSYSVNTWAVGDYFQFSTSTVGQSEITISFDQTGSGTGPRDFEIFYSTNGTTFTTTGATYAVLLNGGAPNASWSPTTGGAAYSSFFDLSALTALDNQATVYFRLQQVTTVSTNAGVVATGGTSRIDNVVVTGVPEPATALLGALGLLGLLRRHR
jgi:PEP-CTERM motif